MEGPSVRALARKYGVHRRTVRDAVGRSDRRRGRRCRRVDHGWMLRADLDMPHKQWHMVKRIFDRLVAEREMEDVSYATVCDYLRSRSCRCGRDGSGAAAGVHLRSGGGEV